MASCAKLQAAATGTLQAHSGAQPSATAVQYVPCQLQSKLITATLKLAGCTGAISSFLRAVLIPRMREVGVKLR